MQKYKTIFVSLWFCLILTWCQQSDNTQSSQSSSSSTSDSSKNQISSQFVGANNFQLENYLPASTWEVPLKLEEDLCHYFITTDGSQIKFIWQNGEIQETKLGSEKIILSDGEEAELHYEGSLLKLGNNDLYNYYFDTNACWASCDANSICVNGSCQEELWEQRIGWSPASSLEGNSYDNEYSGSYGVSTLKFKSKQVCEEKLAESVSGCVECSDNFIAWGYCINLLEDEGWCTYSSDDCNSEEGVSVEFNSSFAETGVNSNALKMANYLLSSMPSFEDYLDTEECSATPDIDVEGYDEMIIVFDASGSMGGKLNEAKDKTNEYLGRFAENADANTKLGIIVFGGCDNIEEIYSFGDLDLEQASVDLDSISTGGGTPLDLALEQAYQKIEAEGLAGSSKTILLISDGYGNCGSDDPLEIVNSHNENDIALNIIGFDAGTDSAKLQAMAEAGGGTYFDVISIDDLEQALYWYEYSLYNEELKSCLWIE